MRGAAARRQSRRHRRRHRTDRAARLHLPRWWTRCARKPGFGLARAENLVDATQNADSFVEVSGILKAHAVNLFKISSDLRLLASGPRTGLGELRLPAVQAGSSIMPGKVNPVICEAVGQAAMLVIGNDATITLAAQSGQLELNAFLPLLAHALLQSLSVLDAACRMFRTRCVEGITADRAACEAHVQRSWATVTALLPRSATTAPPRWRKQAQATGRSVVRIGAWSRGCWTPKRCRRCCRADAMTGLGYRG